MNLAYYAGWVAISLMVPLAVFQLLLALGLPAGKLAWGGKYRRLPARLRTASLVSGLMLIPGTMAILERSGILVTLGRQTLSTVVVWMMAGIFSLSILGNVTSKSGIERAVMTPVAVMLALCCTVTALG
jgi:hypothetical protein